MLMTKIILVLLCVRIVHTSALLQKNGTKSSKPNKTDSLCCSLTLIESSRTFSARDIYQTIKSILIEQLKENGDFIMDFLLSRSQTSDLAKHHDSKKTGYVSAALDSLSIPKNHISRLVNFVADLLLKLSQPFVQTQVFVFLVIICRPIFVSLGTMILNQGAKLLSYFIHQEPILDSELLKDQSYEAYPVFIPGYGSYILLSDYGSLAAPIEKIINEETRSVHNITVSYQNVTKINETIDLANSKNQTTNYTKESVEKRDDTSGLYKSVSMDIDGSNIKPLFLGQTHLIPVANRPYLFESTKDLSEAKWTSDTDTALRDNIKKIVGTKTSLRSIKKRILLNIIKRLEQIVLKM